MGKILDKLITPFKTPSVAGEVGYNSTTGKLQFYNGVTSSVVDIPAAPSGAAIAFAAYRTASQAFSAATVAKVQLNTEEYDTNSFFDSTTNFRFQPTIAGYYEFNACITWPGGPAAGQYAIAFIYKNGSAYKRLAHHQYGSTTQALSTSGGCIVNLNGSTDYVELWGQTQTAGSISGTGSADIWMTGSYIGS